MVLLYMEYPHRKLPSGIPPTHQTEPPPDLQESVQNLAHRVATTADTLSPTAAACLSPHLQSETQQIPINARSGQSSLNRNQSTPMQMRSGNLTTTQSGGRVSPGTPAGILFPSRIVSPRPSNQSKRVKWPDLDTPVNSAQATKGPRSHAHTTVDDLIDSIAAASACCGPVDVSDLNSAEVPQSPLETVYEVERSALSNNLSVLTDLPMVKEPVETPSASDPIMSFREKKLSPLGNEGGSIDETPWDEGIESRDDISTSSDGEDWAPVSRPLRPPPRAPTVPLQIQLRNAALMREDERREHQQHEQTKLSHVTPRSKQVMQESLKEDGRGRQRPGGPETLSHVTPRSKQSKQECILHSLPPELANSQGSRSKSRRREGSVKSGTTWTTVHDASQPGSRSKKKATQSTVHSGTSWNVSASPRRSPANKKDPSPRSKRKAANSSVQRGTSSHVPASERRSPANNTGPSYRSTKRNGFLKCFPKKREQDTQPRYAEIRWKSGGPDVAENPFQNQKAASHGSPTSCESHVSEIAWKSPTGKKVAKMKPNRVDPEGVYEEGHQYYDDPSTDAASEQQPVKVADDVPILTYGPSIGQVKSSDSESSDERYIRSPRAKQNMQRTRKDHQRGLARG